MEPRHCRAGAQIETPQGGFRFTNVSRLDFVPYARSKTFGSGIKARLGGEAAMRPTRPLLVGVAGGSASGKTTLVTALPPLLPGRSISLLHQDDYYRDRGDLPLEARARLNFDHPSALDSRLLARHLQALLAGRAVESPRYCFRSHSRRPETRRIEPADLIIVEGLLLFHPLSLVRLLDVKVFVEAPADLRLARRLLRDTGAERGRSLASVLDQYLTTVRPMHDRYVAPTRARADLVVTDAADPAQVRRVVRLIRRCLRR
jgi:uridine kinase